jgi:hypothetical protein
LFLVETQIFRAAAGSPFFVIVAARSFDGFEVRFLSHFSPVAIQPVLAVSRTGDIDCPSSVRSNVCTSAHEAHKPNASARVTGFARLERGSEQARRNFMRSLFPFGVEFSLFTSHRHQAVNDRTSKRCFLLDFHGARIQDAFESMTAWSDILTAASTFRLICRLAQS